MMKKTTRLLAMILCLVMCFSLAACGGDKKDETAKPAESSKPSASKPADNAPTYVAPEATAEYEETVISAYQSDLAAPGAYESSDAVGSFFTNMTFRTVTFNNPDTGELEGAWYAEYVQAALETGFVMPLDKLETTGINRQQMSRALANLYTILGGEVDDIPEQAFMMCGSIDDVIAKRGNY